MTTNQSAVFDIVCEIQGICNEAKIDENVHRGPAATFQPSFIVTILILKNLFGFNSERSFLRYLNMHHREVFPTLPEQSWFNRKARKLIGVQKTIHELLLAKLHAARIDMRIVDTMPVPVVKIYRAHSCTSFQRKTEVNFGYCASKKMYYYGEKLSLVVTPSGIPTTYFLTPANIHDVKALKQNIPLVAHDIRDKTVITDRGYYDGELEATLKGQYGATLVVPEKKRHQKKNTELEKALLPKREVIERINHQLQDHMHVDDERARSQSGLVSRVQSSILSFTFGFYLNTIRDRNPLAMKSIVV